LLGVVVYMISTKLFSGRMGGLEGGAGAAFIGGVAIVLLLLSTIAFGKQHALDYISEHITNGFVFAFRAMGPVIPIAGFFFLGSEDFSGNILDIEYNAPAILFDLVDSVQNHLPQNTFLLAFSILIIGVVTGLYVAGIPGLSLPLSLDR